MSEGGLGFAVELSDVQARYGDAASEPVGPPALTVGQLSLGAGSHVALVGPSGAGKTTLLRVLGAALRPASGTVNFEGRDPWTGEARGLRQVRRQIGFVHQDFRLVPQLRVVHNVAAGRLGRWSLGRSLRYALRLPRAVVEEIHELLERLGIEDKLFERTDRLSGGQMQRVAVARALFQRPGLILADEPVASLDAERAREVLGMLRREAERLGASLVVSLHQEDAAREFFDRRLRLRDGEVVPDGPWL